MTRIWIAAVAAVMGSVAVAAAQALPAPPADSGTTSLDTRKIDEAKSPPGSSASPTNGPKSIHDNWRSSSGLNNDPDNPSGAPRSGSGLSTGPTR